MKSKFEPKPLSKEERLMELGAIVLTVLILAGVFVKLLFF